MKDNARDAKIGFDFDEMTKLAQSDPDAFEEKRQAILESFIANQPEEYRQRMKQQQWVIDSTRMVSPNPLASCVRITDLMLAKCYGEGGLVDSLRAFCANKSLPDHDSSNKKSGKIIELKR